MSQYIPIPPQRSEDPAGYAFAELQDLARALREDQEFVPMQMLSVEPVKPRDGMIAYADGSNWDPGEGPGFYGYRNGAWRIFDAAITTYTAASVTKNTGGTATGTVAGTTTMLDGSIYNVVEAASTPGFDIEFAWSGVARKPTELVIRAYYNGSSTHNVTVELYRYSGTPGWDKISAFPSGLDYNVHVVALPDMTNYLSAGAAKVRLYHNSAGNPAHDISIDYIGFTNISAGGSSVTAGSGSVATDAIWDAKGDLAAGTGSNTASRLAVGSNGYYLAADSTTGTGLKWQTLVLENRTSDPGAPSTGQMWLRTDL